MGQYHNQGLEAVERLTPLCLKGLAERVDKEIQKERDFLFLDFLKLRLNYLKAVLGPQQN